MQKTGLSGERRSIMLPDVRIFRLRMISTVILLLVMGMAMTSCAQSDAGQDKPSGLRVSSISVQLTLEQLAAQSDRIITGKVIGMESYRVEDNGYIYTLVTVSIDQWLKGESGTPMIDIKVPGGEIGGTVQVVEDSAEFRQDENVLVFLGSGPEGDNMVTGGMQGKYTIENGKAVGVVPSISGMDVEQLKLKIKSLI